MEKTGTETKPGNDLRPTMLDFIWFVWRARGWMLLAMCAVLALGLLVAIFTKPQYSASAIIAPKDAPRQLSASGLLSQIGAASGMSQVFGASGASLNKMEIFLESLELSIAVIRKNDLLPVLYPEKWDAKKGGWKEGSSPPNLRKAADKLSKGILKIASNPRQNVITVSVIIGDSVAAKRIVDYFIIELNRKIREDAIAESEANRAYLDSQSQMSMDPVLRQRIQELVSMEIEKTMLVSTRPVEVLVESAVPTERVRPRRKTIMITSLGLGLSLCAVGCVLVFFILVNLDALKDGLGRPVSRHRMGS